MAGTLAVESVFRTSLLDFNLGFCLAWCPSSSARLVGYTCEPMSIYPSNEKLVNSEDPLMAATGFVGTLGHEPAEDVFSRNMLCLLWRSSSACSERSMSLICEITFSIEGKPTPYPSNPC